MTKKQDKMAREITREYQWNLNRSPVSQHKECHTEPEMMESEGHREKVQLPSHVLAKTDVLYSPVTPAST